MEARGSLHASELPVRVEAGDRRADSVADAVDLGTDAVITHHATASDTVERQDTHRRTAEVAQRVGAGDVGRVEHRVAGTGHGPGQRSFGQAGDRRDRSVDRIAAGDEADLFPVAAMDADI